MLQYAYSSDKASNLNRDSFCYLQEILDVFREKLFSNIV
jgi:hypothetical protein